MFTLRAATPADTDRLAQAVSDGLQSYRSFAPAGWEPPAEEDAAELLARGDVVCLVAEDGAGLAHFRNLFVRSDLWGSALARELHEAAIGLDTVEYRRAL